MVQRFGGRQAALFGSALISICAFATTAQAHVKWFCAYNIAGSPRGLDNVLCPDFEKLVGLSVVLLVLGCTLESTPVGRFLNRGLNTVTAPVRDNTELLIRAACGFFLVAVWAVGGTLLTPEIKTSVTWISWLQLAMAICLLWRQTLILCAMGIVFLFALAVKNYGLFHLLDYPVFLGVAAYLALTGMGRDFNGIRPLDIMRTSAAITLMWASVEKWAYPDWTFQLLFNHPEITMGYEQEFFMRAAGAVEFALSFALLMGPLARRIAALILTGMFISAVVPFGKIDAIGHAPIIAVLLAIIGDDREEGVMFSIRSTSFGNYAKDVGMVTTGFCAAVVGFLAAYYLLHSVFFGGTAMMEAQRSRVAITQPAASLNVDDKLHLRVDAAKHAKGA